MREEYYRECKIWNKCLFKKFSEFSKKKVEFFLVKKIEYFIQ
jgi:hypothetical protein